MKSRFYVRGRIGQAVGWRIFNFLEELEEDGAGDSLLEKGRVEP